MKEIAEVTMVWLAFDMSIALSGLVLLGFGRWLFDLAQRPEANHRRID